MSVSITSAWRDEPDYVVGYYEEIAGKPPVQRNLTSTPLLENLNGYNGHILNHVEGIRQHHYNPIRYHFDHNRSTTLENHPLDQDDERPPPSYVSYNRIVHKCRKRRQLRHEF